MAASLAVAASVAVAHELPKLGGPVGMVEGGRIQHLGGTKQAGGWTRDNTSPLMRSQTKS